MKATLLTFFAVLCVTSTARAQPLRVAVAAIDGPRGEPMRRALAEGLRARGEEVIPFDEVDAATARHGRRIVRLMYRLDVDVFIEGRANAARIDLRMVRRGAPRAAHLRSAARDPMDRIEAILGRYDDIRPAPERARRPSDEPVQPAEGEPEREVPDETDEVDDAEDVEPAEAPPREPAEGRPAKKKRRIPRDIGQFPRVFEGGVSLGIVSRRLRYRDDLFDRAGGYRLGAAPVIMFSGRAHPFTPLRIVGLEDVGISVRGEQDFVESSSREGVSFRTYGARWDVDLLYRFPLGRFQASAWLGYHRRVFSIDSALARPGVDNLPGVPNVRYEGLRLGAEGRARLVERLFAELRIGYVALFGAGAIHSELWFPGGRAGAFELGGTLIYRLMEFMDARIGLDFERVGHTFDPQPGDRVIAGGAADRFTVFWLGLGFRR